MPKQRRMNKQARLELVRSYREEYMSAGRVRRGEILSCPQGSTNYNRKYLIRLLRGKYKHDGICPARIHPNLHRIRHRLRQDEPRLLRRRPRPHAYCAARSMPRLTGSFISPMLSQASLKMSMIP